MSIEAFKATQHAIADATGMAHEAIEQFLREQQLYRTDTLRVPTFHVLPSIVANSDLVAIIPSRLGEAVGPNMRVKVLPMPVPAPPWAIRMYWHERYHNDPPSVWLRKIFIDDLSATPQNSLHDQRGRGSRTTQVKRTGRRQ